MFSSHFIRLEQLMCIKNQTCHLAFEPCLCLTNVRGFFFMLQCTYIFANLMLKQDSPKIAVGILSCLLKITWPINNIQRKLMFWS